MKKNGFVMSTYVYILLVFFLLLLVTMLAVLNNTKLLSDKLKNESSTVSGLIDKDFSFILLGDVETFITVNEEYKEPGFIAQTNNGTILTDDVKINGEVDTSLVGEYTLTYKLVHSGVSKELKRVVKVTEFNESMIAYITSLVGRDDTLIHPIDTSYDAGIRYTGSDPNNYVYFNCDDESDTSTCEIWRIVGVFDFAQTSLIKIVNTSSEFEASWDSNEMTINSGIGINQWFKTDNYEGADLYQLLNGFYLGESETCVFCANSGQLTCTNQCDNESLTSANMKPLTENAKKMINSAPWYTYAVSEVETIDFSTAEYAYLQEMGISTQMSGKTCDEGDYCTDTIERVEFETAFVGLLSASDIAFANGWLYNTGKGNSWTITPFATTDNNALVWYSDYDYIYKTAASSPQLVFPTVYLSPSIKIISGTGTNSNPYVLSSN